MYTFLAIAGFRDAQHVLRRACEATQAVIPNAGAQLDWSETAIGEIEGGWFTSRPNPEPDRQLLTDHRDDRYSVLAFGEVYDATRETPAELVCSRWCQGGEELASRINGNFAAVVIDRHDCTVSLVCDLFGRRRLRFTTIGDSLLISNHDVPLVATGRVKIDFDAASAASIVACDWSLGGAGLLKGVRVQDPFQSIQWRRGMLAAHQKRILSLDDRIDPGDEREIATVLDQMEESMCRSCRAFVERQHNDIHVDLTAGMDSRATFSLIWSIASGDRIVAHTSGQPQSEDAAAAAWIARECNVRHELEIPHAPSPADFGEDCRIFAYFENGSTNAKRATTAPITYSATEPEFVGGGLSEIYRGFYYPKDLDERKLSLDEATAVLQAKIRYQRVVRPEILEQLLERHRQVVSGLASLSPSPWDVLDLYYTFERIAHWAGASRSLWTTAKFMPFGTPELFRLAYRLPPPVGRRCSIQRKIIMNRLPFTYALKFNGQYSYEDLDRGIVPRKPFMPRVTRRLKRIWPRRKPSGKSHETIRAELFATDLGDEISGLLLEDGAVSGQVFGRKRLKKLIHSRRSGAYNYNDLQGLGFMVTIEHWRKLIEQAATLAGRG